MGSLTVSSGLPEDQELQNYTELLKSVKSGRDLDLVNKTLQKVESTKAKINEVLKNKDFQQTFSDTKTSAFLKEFDVVSRYANYLEGRTKDLNPIWRGQIMSKISFSFSKIFNQDQLLKELISLIENENSSLTRLEQILTQDNLPKGPILDRAFLTYLERTSDSSASPSIRHPDVSHPDSKLLEAFRTKFSYFRSHISQFKTNLDNLKQVVIEWEKNPLSKENLFNLLSPNEQSIYTRLQHSLSEEEKQSIHRDIYAPSFTEDLLTDFSKDKELNLSNLETVLKNHLKSPESDKPNGCKIVAFIELNPRIKRDLTKKNSELSKQLSEYIEKNKQEIGNLLKEVPKETSTIRFKLIEAFNRLEIPKPEELKTQSKETFLDYINENLLGHSTDSEAFIALAIEEELVVKQGSSPWNVDGKKLSSLTDREEFEDLLQIIKRHITEFSQKILSEKPLTQQRLTQLIPIITTIKSSLNVNTILENYLQSRTKEDLNGDLKFLELLRGSFSSTDLESFEKTLIDDLQENYQNLSELLEIDLESNSIKTKAIKKALEIWGEKISTPYETTVNEYVLTEDPLKQPVKVTRKKNDNETLHILEVGKDTIRKDLTLLKRIKERMDFWGLDSKVSEALKDKVAKIEARLIEVENKEKVVEQLVKSASLPADDLLLENELSLDKIEERLEAYQPTTRANQNWKNSVQNQLNQLKKLESFTSRWGDERLIKNREEIPETLSKIDPKLKEVLKKITNPNKSNPFLERIGGNRSSESKLGDLFKSAYEILEKEKFSKSVEDLLDAYLYLEKEFFLAKERGAKLDYGSLIPIRRKAAENEALLAQKLIIPASKPLPHLAKSLALKMAGEIFILNTMGETKELLKKALEKENLI